MTDARGTKDTLAAVTDHIKQMYGSNPGQKLPKEEILRGLQNVLWSPRAERLEEDRGSSRIAEVLNSVPDGMYDQDEIMQRLGVSKG